MHGGGDELSIEELASNLSTYKEQLDQVRSLLDDDPGNSEYEDMEKELAEVIALTEELLETARQSQKSGLTFGTGADVSPSLHHPIGTSQHYMDSGNMSDQSDKLPVGTKVQAVWSEDGEWYDATIEALTPNGYFVSYEGWGNKEEYIIFPSFPSIFSLVGHFTAASQSSCRVFGFILTKIPPRSNRV